MKFCIITPTYNRAYIVGKTINSVLSQTYNNWEMIVVNDASLDNTNEIMDKFLVDKRIKYKKLEKNLGMCGARNAGINMISSDVDWVCFLDSDDMLIDDAFELMIKKIKEFPKLKHFAFSVKYENEKSACILPYDNYIADYKAIIGGGGRILMESFVQCYIKV